MTNKFLFPQVISIIVAAYEVRVGFNLKFEMIGKDVEWYFYSFLTSTIIVAAHEVQVNFNL
jgi:hypothetical protein